MKFKKGDTVLVTLGKNKGSRGKVEKILPSKAMVIVAGVNTYKRHKKRRDEKNPGGIVDMIKPIDVAKVALICPSCGKPTRAGYVVSKNDRTRICKKCNKKL